MRFEYNEELSGVVLHYEPLTGMEEMQARLGVDWDDAGRLIRYAADDVPGYLRIRIGHLDEKLSLLVKKVFHFRQDDLLDSSTRECLSFRLANKIEFGGHAYFKIPGRIFDVVQDVLIDSGRGVTNKWEDYFCAGYERRTSIVKKISSVLAPAETTIVIGGEAENAIPWDRFDALIASFPTTVLLQHYGEMQIAKAVEDFLSTKRDYSEEYRRAKRRILNKNEDEEVGLGSKTIKSNLAASVLEGMATIESLLERGPLVEEEEWQGGVLSVLPAIYPQYIAVLREAEVPETISKDGKKTTRYLDYLLVDSCGNVDILEMKKAFPKNSLISKNPYRDNYIPARELSGGICQIEKYIYYLNHLGSQGEKAFSDKCRQRLINQGVNLPEGLELRCLNPHGILMMGSAEFSKEEQRDFDLIRRQYAHIVDIMTYDDLLVRLKNMARVLQVRED